MGGAVGDTTITTACPTSTSPASAERSLRNNGDGTFTDVTKQAGVADPPLVDRRRLWRLRWRRLLDLMVTNYVDFQLNDLPAFGSDPELQISRH